MTDKWSDILYMLNGHSGIITTSQIEDAGISRVYLKRFVENEQLERIGHGKYALPNQMIDPYAVLQDRSHVLLFSHGTALYFWNLSDRVPHVIDVTVPSGTNVSRIKKDNPDLHIHYISRERYETGLTETTTPLGSTIRLYDKERCICDIIRDKKKMDMQIYTEAIKEYFNDQPDMRKLIKYSRQFGIEERVRTYAEVLI